MYISPCISKAEAVYYLVKSMEQLLWLLSDFHLSQLCIQDLIKLFSKEIEKLK